MRAALLALRLLPGFVAGALNSSHPFWIITSKFSRYPDEMCYLTTSDSDGEGALRGWEMDYGDPDDQGKFVLFPTGHGTWWLVGAYESRKAAHMLYLDSWGKTQTWPFHPEDPDPQSEWKIVPWDEKESTYFIISGEESRYANEMLYITDFGSLDTWSANTEDVQAAFVFLPAPPSPPLDYAATAAGHTAGIVVGITAGVFVCICLFCCQFAKNDSADNLLKVCMFVLCCPCLMIYACAGGVRGVWTRASAQNERQSQAAARARHNMRQNSGRLAVATISAVSPSRASRASAGPVAVVAGTVVGDAAAADAPVVVGTAVAAPAADSGRV